MPLRQLGPTRYGTVGPRVPYRYDEQRGYDFFSWVVIWLQFTSTVGPTGSRGPL